MTRNNTGKGRVSITLPSSMKRRVSELAREDGVSESAWMAAAVIEKIGGLSAAASFQKRGARGSAKRGLSILRRAGTQPPRPGDERGWRRRHHLTLAPHQPVRPWTWRSFRI